ncbi:uncharacterized protein LOC119552651 [Drosophila subpulchrella]|uniref:uncharacterized protein LOC119552651 n=1 Tax=Drosophila subpulchrella TaxID=1486046 RepID=UPI0018A13078|nr:uncharacterized protein LOC119552651 [Drosophila subpulchrella]
MEQPDKDIIKVLEAEAQMLGTTLALQNAGAQNNRLKLEVTRLQEILEKQRKVLQKAEDNRKEGELIFSTLLGLNNDTGSNLTDSSDPLNSETPSKKSDEDGEKEFSQ